MARSAACWLGAFEGRNWELSLLISLPIEGSVMLATMAMATQTPITSQRKRTEKRPSPAKKRSGRVKSKYLLVGGPGRALTRGSARQPNPPNPEAGAYLFLLDNFDSRGRHFASVRLIC